MTGAELRALRHSLTRSGDNNGKVMRRTHPTIGEFAAELGVHDRTLQRYEAGRADVPLTIQKLARLLVSSRDQHPPSD
jgi:transcriptional regulator with XRE-family HTH domain